MYKVPTIALVMFVLLLAACGGSAQNSGGVSCSGSLKVTSGVGIGEGLKLLGNLNFQVDSSGGLNGIFSPGGQPDIVIVGQVSGRAVNLSADLGGGQYLFGTGTVQSSANGCPMIAGGPLAVDSAGSAGGERTGLWFYEGK